MELLISASLIAAFIAGIAALFAPCCIGVLLPSYLASVFRQKFKVFLMTFIFFLGILTVFLPLGLGFAGLGQILSREHNSIFAVGGLFLVFLGVGLLAGQRFSLPFQIHPRLKDNQAVSVFSLGVFSGAATTCCAPVLAGVMALAVLPGSLFWGGMYALSYTLGMAAPLFLIASFLDKANFNQKIIMSFKKIEYRLLGKKISLTVAELLSAVIFLAMGGVIIFLALTNKLFIHSQEQVNINIFLAKTVNSIQDFIKFIPPFIFPLLLWAILSIIIKVVISQFKKTKL